MEAFWGFLRRIYVAWGSDLSGKYDKLIAYITIAVLIFLTIIDTSLDWQNYRDLGRRDYMYSLATGPPKQLDIQILLIFTLAGTMMCVFEIVNSMTLICHGGHMKWPVELEQIVSLLMCQIPQASINLAISMCRNNTLTNHQSASCFMGLINVTARLYGYGFLRERVFIREHTGLQNTLTLAKYITATVIWVVLLLTQAFTWDQGRVANVNFLSQNAKERLLSGVSISLVRLATHESQPLNQSFSYKALNTQDKSMNPYLVGNLTKAIQSAAMLSATQSGSDSGVISFSEYYHCNSDPTAFQPPICFIIAHTSRLKFKFVYDNNPDHFHVTPLGEVQYNYAIMSSPSAGSNSSEGSGGGRENCTPSEHDLKDHWHLRYYRFVSVTEEFISYDFLKVQRAWKHVCITPYLRYNQDIDVCK